MNSFATRRTNITMNGNRRQTETTHRNINTTECRRAWRQRSRAAIQIQRNMPNVWFVSRALFGEYICILYILHEFGCMSTKFNERFAQTVFFLNDIHKTCYCALPNTRTHEQNAKTHANMHSCKQRVSKWYALALISHVFCFAEYFQ